MRLGELTFGYEETGTGTALVLVHGHPFDRSMWRPQIEHFSRRGWRVIAPDLRGYGESTVVPGKTTLETFARDISGLLDRLGVQSFVLGGLSMGGQIAMEIHRLFPDRVRGLVLADTSAVAETADGKVARHQTADRLLRKGMSHYADEALPKMLSPQNIKTMPDVAAHVASMMKNTSPEGAAAALRGRAERPDYLPELPLVAVPALVIVGSDDEFTPVSDAELIHELIPDARLGVIDGAAHMPNLERPAEFNSLVEQFLERIPAPAATEGRT
ncbi:alpha/beta fold hydrolase [Phytoactinopolyspora mesophila]|uniref:Alpha/beta fold hydrolase n=1 Tax=Phytoactinopolyspora mesophila TaxID=2650750 RepID=A0A7K3M4M8_9ACTN|nr:alpha/beta hydrolase [Phytoactinopolyspora mesophila]NDL58271.1 alpha/beta fold hydrolase [Phytoactinopolyspora mesophila]